MTTGLARSVQARLVQRAKEIGIDPNVIFARFACERLLYRLSLTAHAERFVLKGALLLLVWLDETTRPTRDADLLGFGTVDVESLRILFGELCTLPVEPDGLAFDVDSLRVFAIRIEDPYGGLRVEIIARLGQARIRVQVDVGIGDATVPVPQWIEYPSMLALPRPRIRAYRPETAIAEKLHAIVVLGGTNSRMKDFFDVYMLASRKTFDRTVLADAVAHTFERRATQVPVEPPVGFTPAFAAIPGKRAQWDAFVRRVVTATAVPELTTVIDTIAAFAMPVFRAVAHAERAAGRWEPGGPWR